MQTLMRRDARGGCARQTTSECSTTVSGLPEVFDEIDIVRRTVVLEASESQSGGLARSGCEIFEELGRPAPRKEFTMKRITFGSLWVNDPLFAMMAAGEARWDRFDNDRAEWRGFRLARN